MTNRHVALLRGINVGGKHLLPMKDLATMFVAAGCTDVQTYIQSGNVVFAARPPLAKKLSGVIAAAIEKKFGYRLAIVIRTADELRSAVGANPLLKAGADPDTLHLAFLGDLPSADRIAALDPSKFLPDRFVVQGKHIYLCLPNGAGRSKLASNYFDVKLATPSTVRNWRTVLKLLDLL